MRSFAAFLAIFLAIAKAVEGIKLSEWFGLRIPNEPRDLQAPGVFNLCADAFAGPNNHLLALLAANGHVLAKWVPAGDQPFTATVDLNAGTLVLSGNLIPKGATNFDNIITIDFTYSNPVTFESCWCASTQFLGGPVNYNKTQNQCNLDSFLGRPATNADQFFCPTCEANQCQAAAVPGAPDPVFRDWIFFTQVSGTITGPGISLFYQFIINSYGVTADFGVCTPDITNVPLPQLACSNFATPEQGTGWGVNGKNQNCGFSSWFNCAELLPQLGGDNVRVHIADINLDLITCPQPLSPSPTLPIFVPPTVSPTTTPTTTPTKAPTTTPTHPPTRSPTLRPTAAPTTTPSTAPTPAPTTTPTIAPTVSPSTTPTPAPTGSPTEAPTISPSTTPTHAPTSSPTVSPTKAPTTSPTTSPTPAPTTSPTTAPTVSPSTTPTHAPTTSPTVSPTPAPTTSPTTTPTASPTISPTFAPTPCPKPPPCKKIEVCVPCKFFPNDTKCVEDFNVTDFLMGDP